MIDRPRQARLIAAKAKARRQGWLSWIQSEADEHAILEGCYVDQARADHVLEFGRRYLVHQQGDFAGKPFELLEWQREKLFKPLFGWVTDSEEFGRTIRRYRRTYVQIPKKNGKSALAAYVALYMTMGDGEPGAECYSASTDKSQAGIVWSDAANMAEASPALSKMVRLNRVHRVLNYQDSHSFYRVLSSCPRRNEGWKAHLIVADELHKWYGRELYDALRWAFASRAEPLLFQITTAGSDPTSVAKEQYDYAKLILAGKQFDPQFFPLIYEAEPGDDPDDEATWFKSNPSLGRDVTAPLKLSSFRSDHQEAKQNQPLWEAWKQLRLNVWRSSTQAWIDTTLWDAGAMVRRKRRKRIDCWEAYDASDLQDWECWGGLDLALTTDLSAFVLVFPDDLDATTDSVVYRTLARFWLPEETAKRFSDRVPYLQWAREGWITLTPGEEVDFNVIIEDIVADNSKYAVHQVAFDPTFASYPTQRLALEHDIERVEFTQSMANYNEPSLLYERLIRQGRIRHSGNPILTWCLGNTNAETDSKGRMRPAKLRRNDHRRIDGTVATIMALAIALRHQADIAHYDDHDPEFI